MKIDVSHVPQRLLQDPQGLLQDKVALITGAAAGIGEAIAYLFAEQGAHVFVLDLNESRAAAVANTIGANGGSGFSFHTDTRDPETVRPAVQDALNRYGHIDALVNNAGIYSRKSFLEMTEEDWDSVHETNLICTSSAETGLHRRGRGVWSRSEISKEPDVNERHENRGQ